MPSLCRLFVSNRQSRGEIEGMLQSTNLFFNGQPGGEPYQVRGSLDD